jgi:hypothetical protein
MLLWRFKGDDADAIAAFSPDDLRHELRHIVRRRRRAASPPRRRVRPCATPMLSRR